MPRCMLGTCRNGPHLRNAKDSAVQSDVTDLKIAVVSLQTSGDSLPVDTGMTGTTALPTTPDWKGTGATVSAGNTTGLR